MFLSGSVSGGDERESEEEGEEIEEALRFATMLTFVLGLANKSRINIKKKKWIYKVN